MLRNKLNVTVGIVGLLAINTVLSAPAAHAQRYAKATTRAISAGTVLPVKLDRELKSNDNQKGDKFTATLKSDAAKSLGMPEGTVVEGTVNEARPKEGDNPGVLDISFQRLRFPDGKAYSIVGSSIGLDNKSVSTDKNGRIVAKKSAKNNRLTYVGYGAGAGLLVSVLSGGKLHLENIALGGALGYLAGALEKNKKQPHDVDLKEGTEVGVRLDKTIRIAASETN